MTQQQYQQAPSNSYQGIADAMLKTNDPWNTNNKENNIMTEANYSFTAKTESGNLLTVRGMSASEFNNNIVEAVESGDLLSNIGRFESAAKAGAIQIGAQLGGQSVTPHQNAEQLGLSQPEPQPAYQQAPPTQQPQQQSYQQSSYQPQQSTAQAPAPASPPSSGEPQGPFIPALGMNATYKEGQNARGPWRAFFDPRPYQQVKHITQSTDRPDDPGIAAGTHKFSQFIR